jgi:hypothetical protein
MQSAVRTVRTVIRTADCVIRCTDCDPSSGLCNPVATPRAQPTARRERARRGCVCPSAQRPVARPRQAALARSGTATASKRVFTATAPKPITALNYTHYNDSSGAEAGAGPRGAPEPPPPPGRPSSGGTAPGPITRSAAAPPLPPPRHRAAGPPGRPLVDRRAPVGPFSGPALRRRAAPLPPPLAAAAVQRRIAAAAAGPRRRGARHLPAPPRWPATAALGLRAVAVKTRLLAAAVPERARAACRFRATGCRAHGLQVSRRTSHMTRGCSLRTRPLSARAAPGPAGPA